MVTKKKSKWLAKTFFRLEKLHWRKRMYFSKYFWWK